MTLEEHTIASASGKYRRRAWYWAGPHDQTHPLCLFLDAELYLEGMNGLSVLRELVSFKEIPPVSLLFLSHLDKRTRQIDYICQESFSRYVAEEIVTWARNRNPGVQRADHLIGGLSLSGLSSAYTTFQHPQVFSRALCQSGSFWWLAGNPISLPRTTARFWMSVGSEETTFGATHPPEGLHQSMSQRRSVQEAVSRFQELGATVHHHIYPGGHSLAAWETELRPALRWLL